MRERVKEEEKEKEKRNGKKQGERGRTDKRTSFGENEVCLSKATPLGTT